MTLGLTPVAELAGRQGRGTKGPTVAVNVAKHRHRQIVPPQGLPGPARATRAARAWCCL